MKLHLVGGFLGSGKTTAIIGAAKQFMQQGQRVGVITNDQGKYLVDTAFFQLADIPTVEVTGGCFCCNYDDLGARLAQLAATHHPDVIFAESVGSCADLVATVIKPLQQLNSEIVTPASLSVFADGRLLSYWLQGSVMPFADDIVYIFEKQLEEAGLIVLNKIDLLSALELENTVARLAQRFPGKPIHRQNSHDPTSLQGWLHRLDAVLPQQALEIDYHRYGAGEAALAWLDQEMEVTTEAGQERTVILRILSEISERLRRQDAPVGHLKFIIKDRTKQVKVSFPTLMEPNWATQVPALSGGRVKLLINARVQLKADILRQVVEQAIHYASRDLAQVNRSTTPDVFHPRQPTPTHRLA